MNFKNTFTSLVFFIVLLIGCTSETTDNQNATSENSIQKGLIEKENTYLEYQIEGKGMPCIVLGSTNYHSRTFSENLRNHYQLIFYTMPWYVADYFPEDVNTVNLESVCLDIEKLRQKLELDKFAIMGHSINGLVAFEYARRYPQHVTNLILISTPSHKGEVAGQMENNYWQENASVMRKMKFQDSWARQKDSIAALNINDGAIATFLANGAIYWYNPDYDARWLWKDVFVNTYIMSHMLIDIFREFDLAAVPQISTPTFIAMGHFDFSNPPTHWDERKHIFQSLEYHKFDKSGSMPQLEEAELFDQRLTNWMN